MSTRKPLLTPAQRNLLLLAVTLLLLKSTWFSASAVIPQVEQEWQLTSGGAARLTVAVQWGFVAGAVLSAALSISDVLAPTRLIFLSSLGAAGANLVLLVSGGAAGGTTARFLTGLFVAGIYPPALKLIATWYRAGRGAAMGLLVGALTVSSGLPHLVNALGGLNWRLVIVATSVFTVAGGALTLLAIREGPYPFPKAVLDPGQVGAIVRNRGVRLASLGYLCHMWELYAMWTWILVFFTDALSGRGLVPTAPAYITFAAFVAGGVGNLTGGMLGDRVGRERVAIAMMLASALCALTIGWFATAPVWVLALLAVVWGYAVVADSVQFSALVTELADQTYVGTAVTLQMAFGFALTGATIWLVPLVRDAAGWPWAFALLAAGPLCGAAVMWRLLRLRQDAAGDVRPGPAPIGQA